MLIKNLSKLPFAELTSVCKSIAKHKGVINLNTFLSKYLKTNFALNFTIQKSKVKRKTLPDIAQSTTTIKNTLGLTIINKTITTDLIISLINDTVFSKE